MLYVLLSENYGPAVLGSHLEFLCKMHLSLKWCEIEQFEPMFWWYMQNHLPIFPIRALFYLF